MELTETIQSLNLQLKDLFGIDTISGIPIWRIVWSEEQFENRLGTYDDYSSAGLYLRTVKEVRLVPKYRQWIQDKYVLERLVIVPIINEDELPDTKISYEPMWVFETNKGMYLPPRLDVAKFIIDSVYSAMGKSSLAKYKDPEYSQEESLELKKQRVNNLVEAVFGDETDVSDALTRKEGIVVPSNYKGN